MKTPALCALFAATLAFSLQAEDAAPFANFQGDFSRHGVVKVSGGNGAAASGRIKQRFHVGADGQSARLSITGAITLGGAKRAFSAVYVFRRPADGGIRVAAVSNLAPGIDDGHAADDGSYTVTPASIRAGIPFVLGTTTGTAALLVQIKRRSGGAQLLVSQTLATNTLLSPITWRFKSSRRQ